MRILITTGIFVPEIGGPASFAARFARELINQEHQVSVVTYSDKDSYAEDKEFAFPIYRIKRGNKLSNYWRYYRKVKALAGNFDAVYALDHFSAGYPAALACQKIRRPFFVRVGGDFLWEKYLADNSAITMREFYEKNLHLSDKLRWSMMQFVFRVAQYVIFTTDFQKEIFQKYYGILPDKAALVQNALPENIEISRKYPNRDIIFAGRLVNKNNLQTLLEAWKLVHDDTLRLLIIGDGPQGSELQHKISEQKNIEIFDRLDRQKLAEKISGCYLLVFPSATDISPNLMLEAISMRVPFISTAEIGFDWVKKCAATFEPFDSQELANIINRLADKNEYEEYCRKLASIDYNYSYADAVKDTLRIFER